MKVDTKSLLFGVHQFIWHPKRIAKGLYWDEAWSLVSGCTHVSPGCDHCWSAKETHMRAAHTNAKIMARNEGLTDKFGCFNGQVRANYEFLDKPLRKKKPTVYAVWNDLFHPMVSPQFIDHVFATMLACYLWKNKTSHIFLILTKQPERMKEYFSVQPRVLLERWAKAGDGWLIQHDPDVLFSEMVYSQACHDWDENGRNSNGSPYKPWGYLNRLWPLPNVWLGVTAENQQAADERIPILLQIPAAVRWVSVEPMLGPVEIEHFFPEYDYRPTYGYYQQYLKMQGIESDGKPVLVRPGLDWVVCGGESGAAARPMHPNWVQSLRDQCQTAGVPFFFKQWGEWISDYPHHLKLRCWKQTYQHGKTFYRVGKNDAGRILDGRTWDEMPEATQVRG